MPKAFRALALLLAVLAPPAAHAHDNAVEHQVTSAFIYRFAQLVTWPDSQDASGAPMRICAVSGIHPTPLLPEMEGRAINGRPVEAFRRTVWELEACDVLYLHQTEPGPAELVGLLARPGLLTVSDAPGFARAGGIIELYREDGRLRFRINLDATKRAGLDISSRLLKLASVFREQGDGS